MIDDKAETYEQALDMLTDENWHTERALIEERVAAAEVDRDAVLPPKGSRLSYDASHQPVLQDAIDHFQRMFDRRPTVVELAAIGHGIDAGRAEAKRRTT